MIEQRTDTVLLGYEVGSGEPAEMPILNTVVTGQTQQSGKTTTLEAIISRSDRPAIAFVTKRHERSFGDARIIKPYFRERADWQFVCAILEATMQERFRYERPWIVKVCKGADTLSQVQQNVRTAMAKTRDGSANSNAYLMLNEYLKIVVPVLSKVDWADGVSLHRGLNVMDLRNLPSEIHGLIIASTIEWVYQHESGVVTVVPEAWKFIPQMRSSPVKLIVEHLAREGSAGGNYIFLDSQDIAAVDKAVLKSFIVWLLGVQREKNEVQRVLDHMAASGVKKPSASDVMSLKQGQFFLSYGDVLKKVYVQPSWMTAKNARAIAAGMQEARGLHAAPKQLPPAKVILQDEDDMTDEQIDRLGKKIVAGLKPSLAALASLEKCINKVEPASDDEFETEVPTSHGRNGKSVAPTAAADVEELYNYMRARLLADPAVIVVLKERKAIDVQVTTNRIEASGKSIFGRVALMIRDGKLDNGMRFSDISRELVRTGTQPNNKTLSEAMKSLVADGFVTREGKSYTTVADMKRNIAKKNKADDE